jgi:hypothetical protein
MIETVSRVMSLNCIGFRSLSVLSITVTSTFMSLLLVCHGGKGRVSGRFLNPQLIVALTILAALVQFVRRLFVASPLRFSSPEGVVSFSTLDEEKCDIYCGSLLHCAWEFATLSSILSACYF